MAEGVRIVISGGGTGGHIFPAVAIANALRHKREDAAFLFIGAKGRMEMERVPAAGYEIVGLDVRGLIRPLYSPKNIGVMLSFVKSRRRVRELLRSFSPHVVVGVGGYASAPTLNAAYSLGIPCLIQEQNSYAGVTNRSLASKASSICVAYEGMERFFPKEKLHLTGNPVRQELLASVSKEEALGLYGFKNDYPVVLLIGGSLGARTLNESVLGSIELIRRSKVNIIWQTGSFYYKEIQERLEALDISQMDNVYVTEFVSDMSAAYKAADLVVSRAGASSISELCLLNKPSILVPSPNVAEDHQTKNALALVRSEAALMVKDSEAKEKLLPLALSSVSDASLLERLGSNAGRLAFPNAAEDIADEVLRLIKV